MNTRGVFNIPVDDIHISNLLPRTTGTTGLVKSVFLCKILYYFKKIPIYKKML